MGTMKNGVIVLDDASRFSEGARVQVFDPDATVKGFTMADLEKFGMPVLVEAYPGEFDDINRMLQAERDAEVRILEGRERASEND